jgi:hypothetical protein
MEVSKQLYFLCALPGELKPLPTEQHARYVLETQVRVMKRRQISCCQEPYQHTQLFGPWPTQQTYYDILAPCKKVNSFCTFKVPAVLCIYCAFPERSMKISRPLLLCEISVLIT